MKVYGDVFNPRTRSGDYMLPWEILTNVQQQNKRTTPECLNVEDPDSFETYHIPRAIRQFLQEKYNILKPTSIQQISLPPLLRRESALLAAGSGTGKTLAYLLPVFLSMLKDRDVYKVPTRECRPRTIILVPTQELCTQVSAVCESFRKQTNLQTLKYVGGMLTGRRWRRIRRKTTRFMDVLVTTPSLARRQIESRRLFLDDIRYIIIDEADTLLSLPHNYISTKSFKSDQRSKLVSVAVEGGYSVYICHCSSHRGNDPLP